MNKKLFLTIMMGIMAFSGVFQAQFICCQAKETAKTEYARILRSDVYARELGGIYQYYFAVEDLNADGVPELLLQENGIPVTTEIYTYKKGKVIKTNAPEIPAYGELYVSKNRKTFIYYRGGPATFDVMPYEIIEQKLTKGKIKTVNYFLKNEYIEDVEKSEFIKNGQSITESEYESVLNQFSTPIRFVDNSPSNRKLYGVNNPKKN